MAAKRLCEEEIPEGLREAEAGFFCEWGCSVATGAVPQWNSGDLWLNESYGNSYIQTGA